MQYQETLEKMLPDALVVLEEKIKAGDMVAVKMLMDRTVPGVKLTDKPVKLPDLESAPLDTWPKLVMGYVAKGKISPEQARTLAELHQWYLKGKELNEFTEFLRRIGQGEPALTVAHDLAKAA